MEFSDYAETRTPATDAVGLIIPLSKGGTAFSATEDLLNPNRGDWAGTIAFPNTGGRFTGGTAMRGDHWRLTDTLSIGGNDYSPGSIVEAAVNDADPNDRSEWIVYSQQL